MSRHDTRGSLKDKAYSFFRRFLPLPAPLEGEGFSSIDDVQHFLMVRGLLSSEDESGVYDAKTKEAITTYELLTGEYLTGNITPALLKGIHMPTKLTDVAVRRAANTLGVQPAAIYCVLDVESVGSGFLPSGRPKILFERHIFYKQLKLAGIDPTPYLTSQPDIVNTTPGGYKGGEAEWDRMERAKKIDPRAAYKSASWGLFQVMGNNFATLNYTSIDDFVNRMGTSEDEHLEAFVRFVKATPKLMTALQKHDWPTFAYYYNGPNYKVNKYDTKLASAYTTRNNVV